MSVHQALADIACGPSGQHRLRVFHQDSEIERITFAELHDVAGRVADALRSRGVISQERVAIALPTSVNFARAFFGILAAGAVPVPLPPPLRFAPLDVHMRRITLTMRRSKVRLVVSDAIIGGLLESQMNGAGGDFTFVDIAALGSSSLFYAEVAEDDPALVQYTSGTVGDPKGVILSHGNLQANVNMITAALGLTTADVSCSWLPLFHDMGLIGTLLTPALTGSETCLLPPEDFLRDPGCWIRMISR
jgi:acyl-CoA synthetase (AMP-forming)/AMP-acid ligase II